MSRIKEYVMELAEKLGKDFEEVTQDDMEQDFRNSAQITWNDPNSTDKEKEDTKRFLFTKSKLDFDGEVGEVVKEDGVNYLIVD